MMFKKRNVLFLLAFIFVLSSYTCPVFAKSKADKVIKTSKNVFYGVNERIKKKKLRIVRNSDGVRDYYEKGKLRKTECLSTSNLLSPKKCKVEFYYDNDHHPVFVFAWKKKGSKIKEYRGYYGTNGKCYRYIGSDHKVHTYKKGKDRDSMPSMAWEMLHKSQMNLHYLNII